MFCSFVLALNRSKPCAENASGSTASSSFNRKLSLNREPSSSTLNPKPLTPTVYQGVDFCQSGSTSQPQSEVHVYIPMYFMCVYIYIYIYVYMYVYFLYVHICVVYLVGHDGLVQVEGSRMRCALTFSHE